METITVTINNREVQLIPTVESMKKIERHFNVGFIRVYSNIGENNYSVMDIIHLVWFFQDAHGRKVTKRSIEKEINEIGISTFLIAVCQCFSNFMNWMTKTNVIELNKGGK